MNSQTNLSSHRNQYGDRMSPGKTQGWQYFRTVMLNCSACLAEFGA